jgi:hypothetical protein
MRYFKVLVAAACSLAIISCGQKPKIALKKDADVLHENVDQLTQVIIYDVFTPPVAAVFTATPRLRLMKPCAMLILNMHR